MRQFILAASLAYATAATAATPDLVAPGQVGFYYNDNGVPKVDADGLKLLDKKIGMLVLGREAVNGGPIILPISVNHFTVSKGDYQAATTFKQTLTVLAPATVGSYSITITAKGRSFNQRANYTSTVYIDNTTTTATQLAAQLTTQINKNSAASGVKATSAGAAITIEALQVGVDYAITASDKTKGTLSALTVGASAYGDAAYVQDLAKKAAADAGFEYTYSDGLAEIYPNYGLSPLRQPDSADVGFTIFTLRFAEPRDVKTRDEVVHQIVQVAFPTGADAIDTFQNICNTIAMGSYR